MCKVAGVTKITDKNRDGVWIFMQILGEHMSTTNTDGLGYAAFDKEGKIFGEKWLINKSAFGNLSEMFANLTAKKAEDLYAYFGDRVLKNEAQGMILHTRMATCTKNIQNVHPFIDSEETPTVATIHNGVIYNDDSFTKKYSTCDSEVLAHLYKQNKVSANLKNLKEYFNELHGWFTVLNLATDNDGKMIMDVYSDNGRLESYYIPELETRIFSTQASDIKKTADFLGLTCRQYMKMKADTSFRVDVLSGEITTHYKIPKPKYSEADWSHLDKSETVDIRNVVTAKGTFDDKAFRENFFKGITGATNWRK